MSFVLGLTRPECSLAWLITSQVLRAEGERQSHPTSSSSCSLTLSPPTHTHKPPQATRRHMQVILYTLPWPQAFSPYTHTHTQALKKTHTHTHIHSQAHVVMLEGIQSHAESGVVRGGGSQSRARHSRPLDCNQKSYSRLPPFFPL